MPQMAARGTRAFECDRKKRRQKISVRTVRVRQKFARALYDMRCRGSWFAVFLSVSRRFCCSQLSGEFIAYVVRRLYSFLSRGEKIRADVEVTLTETLFALGTGCDVLMYGLQWFARVAASLFWPLGCRARMILNWIVISITCAARAEGGQEECAEPRRRANFGFTATKFQELRVSGGTVLRAIRAIGSRSA
jgi:hypothetical protein